MHIDPFIVLGSAVVGFLVGMTGAGGGALTEAITKGDSIRIPAETLMTFKLEQPLLVSRQQ